MRSVEATLHTFVNVLKIFQKFPDDTKPSEAVKNDSFQLAKSQDRLTPHAHANCPCTGMEGKSRECEGRTSLCTLPEHAKLAWLGET